MIAVCPACAGRYRGKLERCPFDGTALRAAEATPEGLVFGERFEIGPAIGAGAIGVVHRGIDRTTREAIAVKILHDDLAQSESHRLRFLREARTMTRVRHPAIVRVLDISREEERPPWLVMPLYQGPTLKHILQGGVPGAHCARQWVIELARGLAVAHSAGIVHRDLKPANVMIVEELEREPRPVVFDFGLASVQGEPGLTETGEIIGTPLYMAPEQVRGEPACPAMDQYALGCLWFEMVCGRAPFMGKATAVLDAHVAQPAPDASSFAPGLPALQAALIAALLDKSKERRAPAFARLAAGAFADDG